MLFEHIRLRPSLGPVAKQCPSAMYHDPLRPEIRSSVYAAASNSGTALHDVFNARIYPGLPVRDEDLAPFVEKHNVTLTGWYGLGWRSRLIADRWAKLAPHYQNAKREAYVACTLKNGFPLGGTPDLFAVYSDFGVIFDLKTGESEYDYMAQVELYALILHKMFHAQGVKEWYVALFCPMLDKYTNKRITAEYLDALEDFYCESIAKAGISYVMGPNCPICPRLLSCQAMIRSVDPMAADLRTGRDISPYDVKKFRPAIKMLEQMVEHYKALEKALLERVGVIDLGDGYELYFKEEFRDKLKPVESWRILTEEFRIPPAEILKGMKLPKEAVKESAHSIAVKRDKEKGLGVTQVRMFKALDAAGAIEKVPRKEVAMRTKAIPQSKENA